MNAKGKSKAVAIVQGPNNSRDVVTSDGQVMLTGICKSFTVDNSGELIVVVTLHRFR
jgi:hypothetical protein